jgi:hypothetical protein
MFSQPNPYDASWRDFQPLRYPKLVQRVFRDHRPVRPYRRCPVVDRHHHLATVDFLQMIPVLIPTDSPEESEETDEDTHN